MKLCLLSDAHIRFLSPENRTDKDFFATVLDKFDQVLKIASENKCKYILQAGDFFDSFDTSKYVISEVLRRIKKYNIPILSVYGQHDLSWRAFNHVNRTATYVLESAGVLQIVGLDGKSVDIGENVIVHGRSFEQADQLTEPFRGDFNILLTHASVGDKPLFPGHELPSPREFIKSNPGFNLIVIGDYHYAFQDKFAGCEIYNTGVLIRKSINEKEQKPNVIIYDTGSKTAETVQLKFEPWQKIFNIEEEVKQENNVLQQFLDAIKNDKRPNISFEDNLGLYYKNNNVRDPVKELIADRLSKSRMNLKERRELND